MSEEIESRRIGASLNKNSGRGKFNKGDATVGPFTVDIKEYGKSYPLNKKTWAKICTDAMINKKEPALKIVIGDDESGKIRMMVISEDMFIEMFEAWKERFDG